MFVAGTDGLIYQTGGDPQGGFGSWVNVSQGATTPGGPIAAVPWGQRAFLFVVGTDGLIYTTGGDPQGGFGPWAIVPGINTKPGSPITAVPYGQGFALFIADSNGVIYTTSSRFPEYTIDGRLDVEVEPQPTEPQPM